MDYMEYIYQQQMEYYDELEREYNSDYNEDIEEEPFGFDWER